MDEVVINANFGLGESVVSGESSPDQFIVDKHSEKILAKDIRKKEITVFLNESGGTVVKGAKSDEITLTETQVVNIARMIRKIEPLYHSKPIDSNSASFLENSSSSNAAPLRPTSHSPLSSLPILEPQKTFISMLLSQFRG